MVSLVNLVFSCPISGELIGRTLKIRLGAWSLGTVGRGSEQPVYQEVKATH